MKKARILAFAGSARAGSYNKQLVRIAADGVRAAGGEATFLDLRDLPMPLFDEDLERERGMDPQARRFKDLLMAHDALLIASPENNSSFSALLKNAIDWASRKEPGEKPLGCYSGKVAAILSASPSPRGGLRGLVHLRALLANLDVLVLPDQVTVAKAHEAFTPDGQLKDRALHEAVLALGAKLASVTAKLMG